jgi:hypothetical protein
MQPAVPPAVSARISWNLMFCIFLTEAVWFSAALCMLSLNPARIFDKIRVECRGRMEGESPGVIPEAGEYGWPKYPALSVYDTEDGGG